MDQQMSNRYRSVLDMAGDHDFLTPKQTLRRQRNIMALAIFCGVAVIAIIVYFVWLEYHYPLPWGPYHDVLMAIAGILFLALPFVANQLRQFNEARPEKLNCIRSLLENEPQLRATVRGWTQQRLLQNRDVDFLIGLGSRLARQQDFQEFEHSLHDRGKPRETTNTLSERDEA